jgi:hypothetical protein
MFGSAVKHAFHAALPGSCPARGSLPLTSRKYWFNFETGKASALTFAGIHDSNDPFDYAIGLSRWPFTF